MRQRTCTYQRMAIFLSVVLIFSALTGCSRNSRTTNQTEETTFGIDVARYQGIIDWEQVAQSGIDFAMVRVGYRAMADGVIKEDSVGRFNLQEASKAGVSLGVYFFSTAVTEEEAMEEAAWVAELIGRYPITYPVVYDCEGFDDPQSRQYGMSRDERTDIAMAFLKTIESLGYEGMFYASKSELENDNKWETSRIEEEYKIWVAQYPAEPYPATPQSSYSGLHHMWQYATNGKVPGISEPVDLNIAYFGYDGLEPPKSKETPKEVEVEIEALMDFREVSEQVTAKDETNLRDTPSQDSDSQVLHKLQNGEVAQRIAISSSGWSKLIFEGKVYFAVSSYLTTDLAYNPEESIPGDEDGDGIKTQFTPVDELVTAKEVVNLRKLPSTEREDAVVLAELHHGDIATRVGISDNGWSKLVYNGITCYGISSYMETVDAAFLAQHAGKENAGMEFETVVEQVSASKAVNLRTLPSTERADSEVIVKLQAGDTLTRTGINKELEWSRVLYNGQTLYCVSWYLTAAE